MSDAYVYAALLDVLGYRDRLERDRNQGTLSFKDELQRAMHVLSEVNESVYSHQAISDTLILTCADRTDLKGFLRVLREVFVGFLSEGLFIRGGVTYEKHFKSSHVTYSHAVAKAYQLESRVAIYPRIVIDSNIIEMWRDLQEGADLEVSKLICEQNGVFFLNVIDQRNWASIYDAAKSIYESSIQLLRTREAEFAKLVWFERFLLSSPFGIPGAEPFITPIEFMKVSK